MLMKTTTKDKGEYPSLNGQAGIVSAVEATTDCVRGLPCSFASPSELILSDGKMAFLTPLLLYCRDFFIGGKAFLCCLLDDGSKYVPR